MRRPGAWLCLATILLLPACVSSTRSDPMHDDALVGAWRSRIQFTSGAFAGITDLQFMTVYNAGGTLTESSNYDGAPPVAFGTNGQPVDGGGEANAEATRIDF